MKSIIVILSRNSNLGIQHHWLRGIARYAKTAGWHLDFLRGKKGSTVAYRRDILESIRRLRPDGVVSAEVEGLVGTLPEGLPVVWFLGNERTVPAGEALVMHDNESTAEAAARELLSLNFRHYATVGFAAPVRWSPIRVSRFRAVIEAHGGKVSVFERISRDADLVENLALLGPWLKSLPRPCGLFAVSDMLAAQVLSAAWRLGIKVPEDMSVIGVDNDEDLCLTATPTITSVAIDWERGGFLIGRALDMRMRHPDRPPARLRFGELGVMRRASTAVTASRLNPRISRANAYIRAHACEGIDVKDVVAQMKCSRRLAEIRYREATGRTIHDEIREAQIEQALVLLSRRDIPVHIVSDRCGWKSPTAFRAYFIRRFHYSPGEWRLRNLG